jgi:excisionase family DNA binding protein
MLTGVRRHIRVIDLGAALAERGSMVLPKAIEEDDAVLSTADVAKRLDVHRSTVWIWIKNGMIKSERRGTFHAIKPAELERFLTRYSVPPRRKRKKRAKRKKRSKS